MQLAHAEHAACRLLSLAHAEPTTERKRTRSIDNVLASVAVKNLEASIRWYEKVFGRPADSTPMAEVAEWKFEGSGVLQVYQLPERAGSGSFTLAVTRIDQEIDKLSKLGVDTGQQASGPRMKTVMITDPDGNHIAFVEAVGPTPTR